VSAMSATYRATFEDARGQEVAEIHNDGTELSISLRGVDFVGGDFDGLSPVSDQLERARSLFTLQHDAVCACKIDWSMPLEVENANQRSSASLWASLVLGDPLPNGGLSHETLILELRTPFATMRSSGKSGWFEDELLELSAKLGDGGRIRSCITCAYSDYSPYGHGLFGNLACFRDIKTEYAQVKSKAGIFEVWNRMTEYVQETYLCEQFAQRVPGTGYRG